MTRLYQADQSIPIWHTIRLNLIQSIIKDFYLLSLLHPLHYLILQILWMAQSLNITSWDVECSLGL